MWTGKTSLTFSGHYEGVNCCWYSFTDQVRLSFSFRLCIHQSYAAAIILIQQKLESLSVEQIIKLFQSLAMCLRNCTPVATIGKFLSGLHPGTLPNWYVFWTRITAWSQVDSTFLSNNTSDGSLFHFSGHAGLGIHGRQG